MSSSQHHHASSFPLSNDSVWDVPRLHKDKRYRETSRPVPAFGRPPRPPIGVSESPNRVILLNYKSKSSTSVPTLKTCGPRVSPGSSVDMSTSRFSFDGSIYSQTDRPESIAQNLRAKGQRLIRRQNSKFNLRTLEWVEDSDERWTRGRARRSRIQSASNTGARPEISEPYNFQHLTHTHSRHFQQMSRASHHDLESEFSAIRAAQIPRRELQGIKTRCLRPRAIRSEPTSPMRRSFITPPLSPTKTTNPELALSPKLHSSPSADYFPHTSPRLYKDRPAMLPIAPPPRSLSRAAAPDFFTHHHEYPLEEEPASLAVVSSAADCCLEEPLAPETNIECLDYSAIPHAVTTPDNTACILKSPCLHIPKAELPDVPEEDDDGRSTTTSPLRPSTANSGLRYVKSFPSVSSPTQSWSRSPQKAKARDSGFCASKSEECLSQSVVMLPLVGEPDEEIPVPPRSSEHPSIRAQGFDASWEDDIDYCYEHAAEADCDFDWDRLSLVDTKKPTGSRVQSVFGGDRKSYEASSSRETSSQFLPRLETSVPSLYSTDSAKSSSFSSIAGPTTPSYPLPPPRLYGSHAKASAPTSTSYTLSPPALVSKDSASMLREEIYENIFLNKQYSEEALPLQTLRFDPPTSREDSPRSSRSHVSKCNSLESFMVSRSSSSRYLRSIESIGSLPDLVHSKSSRDGLKITQEQAIELAATLKVSEGLPDLQQYPAPFITFKSGQTFAKEVARQSMLQKAASFGSFDEKDEHDDEEVAVLPSVPHHERSQSAAVSQPAGPTHAQRKRSATSVTAPTKSRFSYSLFPSPPTRMP